MCWTVLELFCGWATRNIDRPDRLLPLDVLPRSFSSIFQVWGVVRCIIQQDLQVWRKIFRFPVAAKEKYWFLRQGRKWRWRAFSNLTMKRGNMSAGDGAKGNEGAIIIFIPICLCKCWSGSGWVKKRGHHGHRSSHPMKTPTQKWAGWAEAVNFWWKNWGNTNRRRNGKGGELITRIELAGIRRTRRMKHTQDWHTRTEGSWCWSNSRYLIYIEIGWRLAPTLDASLFSHTRTHGMCLCFIWILQPFSVTLAREY